MKISLIIFLNCLTLIFLKSDELSVFKALVCANILTRKEPNEDNEVNSLSPILLTCFIKINDEQVRRLTEGIDKGFESILSEEEINDLIDMESLKDLSVSEVKKRGEELEEAIKDLQKIQEGYSENGEDDGYDDGYDDGDDDYDEYDDGRPKNNISRKGFIRLIKKGIFNFGNILLSSWYIICILVVFYLLLLEIRRNNAQETNNDKKENKDENDNKKEGNEKEVKDDKKESEDNEEKNKEKENKGENDDKNKDDNKKEKLD